jgi:hypothetical protein
MTRPRESADTRPLIHGCQVVRLRPDWGIPAILHRPPSSPQPGEKGPVIPSSSTCDSFGNAIGTRARRGGTAKRLYKRPSLTMLLVGAGYIVQLDLEVSMISQCVLKWRESPDNWELDRAFGKMDLIVR